MTAMFATPTSNDDTTNLAASCEERDVRNGARVFLRLIRHDDDSAHPRALLRSAGQR